jgi:nucleoside-diphosphate-sugar epimerase
MSARAIDLVRQDCIQSISGRAEILAPLKGQTVVITGAGFTGTWLTELLTTLNDQHSFGTKVVLISDDIDEFNSSRPHLASRSDVSLIKKDVRDVSEIPAQTNWLIHTAAHPDSRYHASSPFETMRVIAEGTAAMFKAVERLNDFRMFLNISSSSVYGSQPLDLESLPESYIGAIPSGSIYAEAKRYGEALSAAAISQLRIPCISARPFAFIGPYQSLESPWAINNFVRNAMLGQAIRILGDGQTVRSYMYPSDMAFWYLRILTGGDSGAVYNVGSPTGISLQSVATLVAAHFSPAPDLRLNSMGSTVPRTRSVPDVSFATKSLGLDLKFDINAAIQRTILWNRSR